MRRQTGAVGATLTACGLILGTGLVASAATAQTSQASAALRYLYAQVHADGSIAGSVGATEDTVISIADNGYDPATLKSTSTGTSAYDYLSAHASAINTAGGAAKYVLAWVAAGRPAAIDASAWLTKLNIATGSGGFLEPNGAFHNASATVETANAYSQSLAVLADVAAVHNLPSNATGWLSCAQRSDGGFGYAIDDSAASPPVSCGDTSSDTNDTAVILEALGRAGIGSANSAAASYLKSVQHSDGGFGFNAAPGSDPSSDTTVIQALLAIGQDPTGTAWTVSGNNPVTNLESFADPQGSGGYVFPGNLAPDAFTTSAVPQALTLTPYGQGTAIVAGSSPPSASSVSASPPPSSSVKAVTVPPTGGAGDLNGASTWALVLLALGSLAIAGAAFRSGDRPAP